MVHTFKVLDRYFMLDVESGSFYEIDELTKKLVDKKNSPGGFSQGEFLGCKESEISSAEREINDLIREGALFAAEQYRAQPAYDKIIKSMCLNISHKCNLRCGYCFAGGGSYNSKAENMPLKVATDAVDFLILNSGAKKKLEIDFFGGEPLLNFDVVKKTVEYCRKKEKEYDKFFNFTLTTNAVLLTDEIIDFLCGEMHNVVLSIDGRKDVHNAIRKTADGGDSFDKAVANSLKFRKKRGDGQYYVRGTFTKHNPDFSKDVIALSDLGFDHISLEPVVLPSSHPLAFDSADIPVLLDEYEKLAKIYLQRRKTESGWFSFFHFHIDVENGPCETKRLKSCGAGCEYVAVTPSGKIYPCHRFDSEEEFFMGTVFDKVLNPNVAGLFCKNNVLNKPECLKCWAKYHCSGGCAANSLKYSSCFTVPVKNECTLFKKRLECALAIYAIENE